MRQITIHLLSATLVSASALGAPTAYAHGGGLAADGCHNDRKNGGRHCHRAPNQQSSGAGQSALMTSRGGAYRNCTEARAAGAAPVLRGQPGYGPHLDRDNDGIGCE